MYKRDELVKYAAANFQAVFDQLGVAEKGSILGKILEVKLAEDKGAELTDVKGSDMITDNGLDELKGCWAYNTGYARWGNITSKKSKFDRLILIDGVLDKEYCVPHDVVFNELTITPASGGEIRTTKKNLEILKRYEV